MTQRAAGPTRVGRLIFALSCGASFLLYLHRYTWGFIKTDLQNELHWSNPQAGWLDGVFNGAYAAGQVPAGLLCERFGARRVLAIVILAWSLALGSIALATGFVQMLLARMLFGVAQAGCYPCLGKVTKQWIAWRVRTTAQGWIATFFGRMGGAVSQVVVGYLLFQQLHVSWRGSLAVLAALGAAYAVIFWLLFRDTPREHSGVGAQELAQIEADEPAPAEAPATRIDWQPLLASRNLWVLCSQQALAVCADNFYVYWLVKYLREHVGLAADTAGWLAFLTLAASAVGGPAGAFLQDYAINRTGNRRWSRSLTTSAAFGLAGLCVLMGTSGGGIWTFILWLMVAKFFADWGQPATWGTVTDICGRHAATLFGCVNMAGAVAGLIVGPITGSLLNYFSGGSTANAVGWHALFLATAGVYFLLCLSWPLVDCTRRIAERPA